MLHSGSFWFCSLCINSWQLLFEMDKLFPKFLKIDPIPALLEWSDPALTHHVRRDLLEEPYPPREELWEIPFVIRLLGKQQEDGSWKYPGKTFSPETGTNYFLLETFRNLGFLISMYRFNHSHPAVQKAAVYIFSCQTDEGDIRGILGNQYMPYYHGALLDLLIQAGFLDRPEITAGLEWLLKVRQEDGGWIVPAQAVFSKLRTSEFWLGPPQLPDRSLPHAHLATGMALRPLAGHPEFKARDETIKAAGALKQRLFQADKYNDRKAKSYWFKFQFPYWWTNLLTALDILGILGFDLLDHDVHRGAAWFWENQEADGLWPTGYGSGSKAEANRRWVGLAVCRMLSRFVRD